MKRYPFWIIPLILFDSLDFIGGGIALLFGMLFLLTEAFWWGLILTIIGLLVIGFFLRKAFFIYLATFYGNLSVAYCSDYRVEQRGGRTPFMVYIHRFWFKDQSGQKKYLESERYKLNSQFEKLIKEHGAEKAQDKHNEWILYSEKIPRATVLSGELPFSVTTDGRIIPSYGTFSSYFRCVVPIAFFLLIGIGIFNGKEFRFLGMLNYAWLSMGLLIWVICAFLMFDRSFRMGQKRHKHKDLVQQSANVLAARPEVPLKNRIDFQSERVHNPEKGGKQERKKKKKKNKNKNKRI